MGVKVKYVKAKRRWYVYINHNGERSSFPNEASARTFAAEMVDALAREDYHLPQKASTEPLSEYADRWQKALDKSLKPATVKYYRDNLRLHVIPALGKVPIGKVARGDVADLIKAVQKKKRCGPSVVSAAVRTLSTLLSEAVEDGQLAVNPALRPGRLRRALRDPNEPKKQAIDPYTREEADALLETARTKAPAWYPFLLCALRTGMRLGELRALRWGDVDWRQRAILVSRNYVRGAYGAPKSGKPRKVDMSRQLRAALYLWRRHERARCLKAGTRMPALVFASREGTPRDDSKVRKAMVRIAEAAEVRLRRSPVHVLRHTCAALLLAAGTPITYVRELLGHGSIQMTVDVYGTLPVTTDRSAVDALDGASFRIPGASSVAAKTGTDAVSPFGSWSRRPDLNGRPADYESATPLEITKKRRVPGKSRGRS